jgi:putative glutamine amidotransferase
MAPTIGITTYHMNANWRGWSEEGALLPWTYVKSIRNNGGRPVLLPPGGDVSEAEATVAVLDGIVIAGGGDINPAIYGAAKHPKTDVNAPDRDSWELAVAEAAVRQGVPLLGICRGAQMLNIACGGTLHQHVPDLMGHERHDGPPGGFGLHQVRVSPDSTLATIMTGDEVFEVPTKHHQSVDLLGDGLKAVAWEEDGTIEAVEAGPSELDGFSGFLLGVQWHPEQGSDLRVFGALVSAAAERAAARNTVLAPMI